MAESTAVSDVNVKPEHVTCEVCLECFDDNEKLPRTLPCHHSFCTQCLISVWDGAPDGVTCPKCSDLFPVEGSIESSFAVSGMLKGITEYMLLKNKPEQIRCHECPDNQNAAVLCVSCREFMCSSCAKCHKKFEISKHHKTVSLSELLEMPAEEFFHQKDSCDLHPHMTIDLFCETCTTTVCSSCGHAYHKDHNIHDLNDVYVEKKKILSTALTSLQKSTTETKTYTATLNSDKTKLDKILKTRLDEIDESVDKFVTQIKNMSEEQKEEVRSNVARQKTVRDEKLKMIGQLEADRADHVTFCQLAMQFERQAEFIKMCERLENKTNSLLKNSHIVRIPLEKIRQDDKFLLLQTLLTERHKGYLFIISDSVSDAKETKTILVQDQEGNLDKVLIPALTFHKLRQFSCTTTCLGTDTPTYYETELKAKIKTTQQQRTERCKVAELGLVVENHCDDVSHISENNHAWCVQVFINADNSFKVKVCSSFFFTNHTTGYSENSVLTLTLGWLLDARTKTLHVIDVKRRELIYSVKDVDVSKPLLPVSEVSNSEFFSVDVNMIPGDKISLNTEILTLISNVLFGKQKPNSSCTLL